MKDNMDVDVSRFLKEGKGKLSRETDF